MSKGIEDLLPKIPLYSIGLVQELLRYFVPRRVSVGATARYRRRTNLVDPFGIHLCPGATIDWRDGPNWLLLNELH